MLYELYFSFVCCLYIYHCSIFIWVTPLHYNMHLFILFKNVIFFFPFSCYTFAIRLSFSTFLNSFVLDVSYIKFRIRFCFVSQFENIILLNRYKNLYLLLWQIYGLNCHISFCSVCCFYGFYLFLTIFFSVWFFLYLGRLWPP